MSAPLLFTQTTGPGTGKEKVSKLGELQQGLKHDKSPDTPRLRLPDKELTPIAVGGRMAKMEDHLKEPGQPGVGPSQPKVDPAKAAQAPKSAGPQQGHGAAAVPAAATTHLHLVVHVTAEGKAEVVRATEVLRCSRLIMDAPVATREAILVRQIVAFSSRRQSTFPRPS